jgi:HAD superfamily hydrolase (TIGR01484 family)
LKAAEKAGITVMFATGRGIQNVLSYADELEMAAPIVTVNGGEVWQAPRQLHSRKPLDHELVGRMRDIALRHDIWYWAYELEGVCNNENWPSKPLEQFEWLKFGFSSNKLDVLAEIRKELEAWGVLELSNSDETNIEVNPIGITKASGLEQVCEMLGISMSEVVAMGDSLNDIAMIRAAGLGVAMGNAQEAVKREADWITLSNEENGVARAIWDKVLS